MKSPPTTCGKHRFRLWSGKIPHVEWQLSLYTLESTLQSERSHRHEKLTDPNWRAVSAHHNWRKPVCHSEDPVQPKTNVKIL